MMLPPTWSSSRPLQSTACRDPCVYRGSVPGLASSRIRRSYRDPVIVIRTRPGPQQIPRVRGVAVPGGSQIRHLGGTGWSAAGLAPGVQGQGPEVVLHVDLEHVVRPAVVDADVAR
jgi:hypothetical protein